MIRGLITALRTLTILRIPGPEAAQLGSALPWFPLVGLLVGGITTGAGLLVSHHVGTAWTEGAAWAMVLAGTLTTGALHLDGLADCMDALGARGDRSRALAIMKDSLHGTFGVLALVLILLAKWICYARLIDTCRLPWVIGACVLARSVQVHLLARQPYARSDGTAAPFSQQATPLHAGLAWLFGMLIFALVCGHALRNLAGVGAALGVAVLWGGWCKRRFGGVTGDTLGAGSELTELAVLIVACWQ